MEINKNLTENATIVHKLDATMWKNLTKVLLLAFHENWMLPYGTFLNKKNAKNQHCSQFGK